MAGEGHESDNIRRGDPSVEVQERGEIFFFFRPKVGKEEAQGLEDVQRFYIVLRPEAGEKDVEVKQESSSGKEGAELGIQTGDDEPTRDITSEKRDESRVEGGHGCEEINIKKKPLLRLVVMGKKGLPDPTKNSSDHSPHWGFVEMVTTKTEDLRAALKGEEYDTLTRGHRRVGPARAAGEGVYLILRHNPGKKMHTHLVYKLELPAEQDERNEPQEGLNIKREASFLMQIKNPEHSQGSGDRRMSGLQRKRRAVFPAHLQAEMGQLRYRPADPPDFLNYEGCEFLLIPASDNISEELGPDIKSEVEMEGAHNCSDLISTFQEAATTITPLLKGTWA